MRRLLRICLGILCLAVAAHPAAAQGILAVLFRRLDRRRRLRQLVPPTGLDPLLGPDTPAFREYIVKSVEQRSYTQGAQTASITLYRLRDPSSAYGAYTFLRNDSLSAVESGLVRQRFARSRVDRRGRNAARCFGRRQSRRALPTPI